jgi:hypothetical protein
MAWLYGSAWTTVRPPVTGLLLRTGPVVEAGDDVRGTERDLGLRRVPVGTGTPASTSMR